MLKELSRPEIKWELARPEDRKRWWVREQLYTVIPRTPLSDSVYTKEWDEAVICIGDVLKFPDSRGFNARTVNGYTYLSPMKITDEALTKERLPLFLASVQKLSAGIDSDLPRYNEEQEREQAFWRAADLDTPNLMSLLELWRRVLVTMDRFWKLHFLIVFPRHVLAAMFEHAAHDIAGLKNSHEIGKLTQSHGMTRQMELDMGLWKLAARAIELGLKDVFLNTLEEDLQEKLEASEKGRAWLEEFAPFLARFGARTVLPLELSQKTWQEDPAPVLGTIRAYVAQGGKYNFDRVLKDMSAERERLIETTLARISDPEARERFRNTLEPARKFQRAMEDDNYYFLWSGAQVRKVALEIGRRLAGAGVLDTAEDVFFLRREQMEQALVDLASGVYDLRPWKDLARTQKAEWETWSRTQPPPYLGDLPDEIQDIMLNEFWGIRGRKQLDETEGRVSGLGASAGVVEGVARHVFDPQEFGKIQPGEIVVCRSTNPAWTPVFSKIAAIVTDQGGTLSHAAVVAREYGIPAVLGTIHATKRIPNGARIRVDGAAGKVEVL
jgi:pyruvate,water dikinase